MKQVLTPKKYARLLDLRSKPTWTRREYFEEAHLSRLLKPFEEGKEGAK
ncbi:hypothetical protein ES703_79558 [subsurface metagenome]